MAHERSERKLKLEYDFDGAKGTRGFKAVCKRYSLEREYIDDATRRGIVEP